jgi:type IV pilus assembly protein PilP
MVKVRNLAFSLLLVIAAVASVIAQTPSTTTTSSTAAAASGTSATDVQKTDSYRYDPQGRRDPFRSLIGPTPRLEPGQRPQGVPGFLIDELKLQGIFKTRQGLTAMVSGPDNKGYNIKVGDKVFDGEVIRITATSVVFRQEVNDPTRIERYREVVKDLSPTAKK